MGKSKKNQRYTNLWVDQRKPKVCINSHCDLDLWPGSLRLSYLLVMTNIQTEFEDIKHYLLIVGQAFCVEGHHDLWPNDLNTIQGDLLAMTNLPGNLRL